MLAIGGRQDAGELRHFTGADVAAEGSRQSAWANAPGLGQVTVWIDQVKAERVRLGAAPASEVKTPRPTNQRTWDGVCARMAAR